jgi:hypothetical protein
MRIFCITLPDIEKDYQTNFNFLTVKYQVSIRTAKFMQNLKVYQNTLCLLFQDNAIFSCMTFLCNGNNASDFCNVIYQSFIGRTM